ncbi:hypothetical protein [uncultured Chitinophaga sp.]|jgi:hypothetical protein|uniref:hypothetical protein n=1 Tax=uncultured Chitinophaga sp. TaxID=339340 RepID=UPI00261660F5|nr:hypothetical protein [uncultured Chitinophaga sp.]
MNRLLALLLAVVMLAGCKSKEKQTKGDRPLTFADFSALFPEQQVPYRLQADSLGQQRPTDSLALKKDLLRQFLSDSLGVADFPKAAAVRFFPLAHLASDNLHYFVVLAADKTNIAAYLCLVSPKGQYLNQMLVARKNTGSKENISFTLDNRFLVKISTEKELSPSRSSLKEDFYTAAADGKLTLIMTNSNGPVTPGQIFNPIDTLPRKHKYSADYSSGDMSIVSIRDGQDPKTFQFFITFSKDNGSCKGELAGVGHFTGPNRGEYKDKESSCGIAFQFSSSRVNIHETGGCGAYRGIRCFFEGSFNKKRPQKN